MAIASPARHRFAAFARPPRRRPAAALLLVAVWLGALCAPAGAGLTPQQEAARIAAVQEMIAREGWSWNAGETSVSGLSLNEMRTRLGLSIPPEWGGMPAHDGKPLYEPLRGAAVGAPPAPATHRQLPERWDWREHDGVTGVRDQDNCGSCWAFASTAAFEAALRLQTGDAHDLSEQQLISCNLYNYGCDGGWMTAAYKHFQRFGAVAEACMPYAADDGVACTQGSCDEHAYLDDYHPVNPTTRDLKRALLEQGPFAVAMAVEEDFFTYVSGCYSNPDAGPPNHAVLLIGWDDELCEGGGAWIAKNSWGTAWGEAGYFKIAYGHCSIGFGAEQVDYTPETGVVIAHERIDDQLIGVGTIPVEATVTTPGGLLAPGYPVVRYRIDGGAYEELPLLPMGGPDGYATSLPEPAPGSLIEYYIVAADDSGHEMTAPLAGAAWPYQFRTGYGEVYACSVEGDLIGWSHGPVTAGYGDQWHLSTQRNQTPGGERCWKCGPPGAENYDALLDAGLVTPPVELPDFAQLRFQHWIDAEKSPFVIGGAYDGGRVEITLDEGETWIPLEPIGGWPYRSLRGSIPGALPAGSEFYSGSEGWREERFDLSAYQGRAQLRFRFVSDGAVAFEGWCLDDIAVLGFDPSTPPPVPVRLLDFDGAWWGERVTLSWRVEDAHEVQGFHLERGASLAGSFSRRTAEMIPSLASATDAPGVALGTETPNAFQFTDTAPASGSGGCYYRLVAVELDGSESILGLAAVAPGVGTPPSAGPRWLANVPNPFRGTTVLRFELPAGVRAPVTLSIHDLQGRCVARPLVDAALGGGLQLRPFDGRDAAGQPLPSGVYYARLRVGERLITRPISLLR